MATAELKEITRSISAEMGGVVGNIRKTAADHQKMFSTVLKDLGQHFEMQSRGMEDVSSTVEQTSNKVAVKVDSTNNLLQDQIGVLSNVYAEMRTLNSNVKILNANTIDNSRGLLDGLMGGFRGLQNVIVGGLASLAPAAVTAGAGMLGGWMNSGSSGTTGGKIESNEFYKSIIDAEGTAKHGDPYNTSLGYATPPKPLTEMTMKESLDWGDYIRTQTPTGKQTNSSAKGAFQIVNTTQRDAMAALGLQETDKFNEENQKKMASWIAHKQGLGAWEGLKLHPDKMAAAQTAMQSGVDKQFTSPPPQTTTTPSTTSDATPTTKSEPMSPGSAEHAESTKEHSGHSGHEGIISGNTKEKSADAGRVTQSQSGTRNMPINDRLMGVLQKAAAEAGVAVNITSGAQPNFPQGPRTGSTRHDIGVGAADLDLVQNGRVLTDNNPEDVKIKRKFVESAASAGATGIGAGEGYMGPSKIHVGFGKPATWGGAGWLSGLNLGAATTPESEKGTSGATPYSGGSAVTPGMGGSVSDRLSQIQQNIQSLGGGVPGAEIQSAKPDMGMGIPAFGGMGMLGAVNINDYIENAKQQMSGTMAPAPPAAPVASMIPEPKISAPTQTIEQSQIQNEMEEYASRESMKTYAEQSKKQTTELASSEATTGTPVMYDYNNVNDVGWPDWAAIVGGNHWQELKKVKLNMFG